MTALSLTFDRQHKVWLIVDEAGNLYGSRRGYASKSVALRILKGNPSPVQYG